MNSPFFHFTRAPTLSLLSKTRKEEMREGERERKGLILVTIRGGWEGKKKRGGGGEREGERGGGEGGGGGGKGGGGGGGGGP